MTKAMIGWDVGGAHLKAVLTNEEGLLLKAKQLNCPLWKGIDQLGNAVEVMMQSFGMQVKETGHVVTMTGELVDLFDNRAIGVKTIADYMTEILSEEVKFYRISPHADDCFIELSDIEQHAKAVASANWHASAMWLANHIEDAIFVDIGSTTTDIVHIANHQVILHGVTDAERMQHDSLVYTGVVRTPVMALAQTLEIDGQKTNVAAEYFATMADVYRLTQELPPSVDVAETADGADKSLRSSARRLARMVGYDEEDKPMHIWTAFAEGCRQTHINRLIDAIKRYPRNDGVPIISAGAGSFLVQALAQQLEQPYQPMSTILNDQLSQENVQLATTCFPAYAIAQLGVRRL